MVDCTWARGVCRARWGGLGVQDGGVVLACDADGCGVSKSTMRSCRSRRRMARSRPFIRHRLAAGVVAATGPERAVPGSPVGVSCASLCAGRRPLAGGGDGRGCPTRPSLGLAPRWLAVQCLPWPRLLAARLLAGCGLARSAIPALGATWWRTGRSSCADAQVRSI